MRLIKLKFPFLYCMYVSDAHFPSPYGKWASGIWGEIAATLAFTVAVSTKILMRRN